jgi:hypothetical protein
MRLIHEEIIIIIWFQQIIINKIPIHKSAPSANMSRPLSTRTLAALAHRAGQCLLEGHAQNIENSRRLLGGTRRLIFSKKGGARFKTAIDLN